MQIPLEITFRHMTPSPALEATIRDCAAQLEEVYPLQRCAVVIETPTKHHRHGAPFHVHLSITIPGHNFEVTRDDRAEYEDAYLAVADAFRVARRQLHDFVASRREARPNT